MFSCLERESEKQIVFYGELVYVVKPGVHTSTKTAHIRYSLPSTLTANLPKLNLKFQTKRVELWVHQPIGRVAVLRSPMLGVRIPLYPPNFPELMVPPNRFGIILRRVNNNRRQWNNVDKIKVKLCQNTKLQIVFIVVNVVKNL